MQTHYIAEREAAAYVGLSVHTLRRWRSDGKGPKYCKIGARAIRYTRADLDEFMDAQKVTPVQ
jgi:excisionase family DNA binding protein